MSNAERLIEQLPEPLLSEVIDFAKYRAHKQAGKSAASSAGFDAFFGLLQHEGRDGRAVKQELRSGCQ